MSLVPTWVKLLVLAALVAAGVAACKARDASIREGGREDIRAEWREAVAAAQAEEFRKAERRAALQKEADDQQTAALNRALTAAADARLSRDGLLLDLQRFVAAAGRPAGSHPAPAAGSAGEPGADPLDLLANLFSRADAGAGELASYADRLRVAGERCERAHDALTATQ